MLGHRSIKTTQIYAKVKDRQKIEAANRIQLDMGWINEPEVNAADEQVELEFEEVKGASFYCFSCPAGSILPDPAGQNKAASLAYDKE
jgi:hypothetical protein